MIKFDRVRTEGARGAQYPRRRITGGRRKSQHGHKYFFQDSITPKRPLVRTWISQQQKTN